MKPSRFLTVPVLIIFLLVTVQPYGFSQEIDYLEDEGSSLWEEQQFLDVTGQEFETEDAQYVGDEEVLAAEEAAQRAGLPSANLAAALERDVQMLPDNILYGVGTGAMLGGWLALVQGNSARENVSYLTIGMLLGALLGVGIGNKTLLLDSRAPVMDNPSSDVKNAIVKNEDAFKPSFIITPEMAKFNLQLTF